MPGMDNPMMGPGMGGGPNPEDFAKMMEAM